MEVVETVKVVAPCREHSGNLDVTAVGVVGNQAAAEYTVAVSVPLREREMSSTTEISTCSIRMRYQIHRIERVVLKKEPRECELIERDQVKTVRGEAMYRWY